MTSQQDQEYGTRGPDDETGEPDDITTVGATSRSARVPSDDDLMEPDGDLTEPDELFDPDVEGSPGLGRVSTASTHDGDPVGSLDLTQQWHDIQARFVDDPSGAVQLAEQAAQEALGVLIASLRERQSALAPATADSSGSQDTERLRGALRDYRMLCQNAEEIGRQITRL